MRLRVSAEAEGKALIPSAVTVLSGEYAVSLFPGDDGLVSRIDVVKKTRAEDAELPTLEPTPDDRIKAHIHIPSSHDEDDLVDVLQHLESLGAFWLGFRRIRWENRKVEWIPETEEDKRRLSLLSHVHKETYKEQPVVPRLEIVGELVGARERNRYLVIPMAFLREGVNEYRAFRYINACFQFYFYVEDLYAEGQWRTKQAKERLLASTHMLKAATKVVTELNTPSSQLERAQIERDLNEKGHPFSPEGLIELIVDMRGDMHHFSQKDPRRRNNPLNQREFKGIAWVMMQFCLFTFVEIVADRAPK